MTLLAYSIRFGEPTHDFVIDLLYAPETERVKMISWRKSLDAPKAGMLKPARQHDMPIHPIPSNNKRREAHAHLKCDPRLLGHDSDRPILSRDQKQLIEDGPHVRRFPLKVRGKRVTRAARMRLITVRELPPALLTAPQFRKARHGGGWISSDRSSGNAPARCDN
jgi:hypothetical protein